VATFDQFQGGIFCQGCLDPLQQLKRIEPKQRHGLSQVGGGLWSLAGTLIKALVLKRHRVLLKLIIVS
jgi:hypothetical protein